MILKRWFSVFSIGGALCLGAMMAQAAGYPDRPVRSVVGYAPGGGGDTLARMIGQKLTEKWGQALVVENRTGADGTIAADFVAHAAPDGYTLLWVFSSHTIAPNEYKVNYDPVKAFAPISLLASYPEILVVNPTVLPVTSVKELIAYAKSKPGELNFGSGGPATSSALFMDLFMNRAGINMKNVSYKGNGPSLVGLLGGEVQLGMVGPSDVVEQIKTGKLRALAITSKSKLAAFPDLPTIAAAADLPDFDASSWNGIAAPAGTPKEIIAKLHDDIAAIIREPEIQKKLEAQGWQTVLNSPEQFDKFLADDFVKWTALLKTIDLK